jgi:simple sugar transport system substrate-binding protein
MKTKTRSLFVGALLVIVLLVSTAVAPTTSVQAIDATAAATAPVMAATPPANAGKLVVGFVLLGPKDDKGWNEAQYRGAQYVESKIPGVVFDVVVYDFKLTLDQIVQSLIDQGAKLIFTTSDFFQDDTTTAAAKYPDVTFINVSGDAVKKGSAPANLGNVMGRMEYMKMIGGCAAALATQKNSIGFVGPLINFETRRLVSSAYLGAKYCFSKYRNLDPKNLKFEVKWIGFWTNEPGTTLDPTEVTNNFIDGGADVVMSGIDTTEALVVAQSRADKGEKVWAVPYDYEEACTIGPKVCLGVPYFNWGPSFLKIVNAFQAGTYKQSWDWVGPDWSNINNPDTSNVGFNYGAILTADQKADLDAFTKDMASGAVNLFSGPLNYQDGTPFLAAGKAATDDQIWYLPQLLEGMIGDSQAKSS